MGVGEIGSAGARRLVFALSGAATPCALATAVIPTEKASALDRQRSLEKMVIPGPLGSWLRQRQVNGRARRRWWWRRRTKGNGNGVGRIDITGKPRLGEEVDQGLW